MAPHQPPILDVRGLRKRFGAVEVLKGIDFAVAPQEMVFLIGPSGSGKSTLLRCCNRLEEPDEGSVTVDGVELTDPKCDLNAARRQIGMVFQAFNLYPHMTALGNVTLALRKVLKQSRHDADEAGRAALDRVGLAARFPQHLAQRERHVPERAQVRVEIEALEDHADAPPHGVDVAARVRELDAVDHDRALVRLLEPVAAAQKRALAGP